MYRTPRTSSSLTTVAAFAACVAVVGLSCSESSDGGGPAGSCNEAAMPCVVCVDYYDGYTAGSAEQTCGLTAQNTYSPDSCAEAVSGCSKVPGRCKVDESGGKVSRITYFTGGYTDATAQAHCSSYNSIPGYSSTWEAN